VRQPAITKVPTSIIYLLFVAASISACGDDSKQNDSGQAPPVYVYEAPATMGDDWEVGTLDDVGVSKNLIEQATQAILDGVYTEIDSFVIVRNSRLVHDVYFGNFSATRRHDLRSATKSITSILIGIGIDQGFIVGPSDTVLSHISTYAQIANWDDRKNDIEVHHLLTMSPGLDCDDGNSSSSGNEGNMYPRSDWVKFLLDLRIINDPGDVWAYCTAGVVSLGEVLMAATGEPADEFAEAHLFGPMGISDYNWEFSPSGQVDTGGHIHMRSRDMAKIGELMLRRGDWSGSPIVSNNWVDLSSANHVTLSASIDYGYLWWRRNIGPAGDYPAYYADGNGGQYIFVVPGADLVVVFTGSNYNSALSNQPFEILDRYVIPALR
jgi:CubicO group peptidase (beta-lactamase class C family)